MTAVETPPVVVSPRSTPPSEVECAPVRWGRWTAEELILRTALLLGGLVYLRSVFFGFVFDDGTQILLNPWITSWSFLHDYFTHHFWAFSQEEGSYYRPMFHVWLRLNESLYGMIPGYWHLSTILVYVLTVALVYVVGKKLLRDGMAAAIGALIFAVYPIHIESVAWIAGVTEPLAGALSLIAFYGYLRFHETRHGGWIAATSIVYAVAILLKETCLIVAALILLHQLLVADGGLKPRLRTCIRIGIPLALWTVVFFLARSLAMRNQLGFSNHQPIGKVLLQWPQMFCLYAAHLVWPFQLSYYYDTRIVQHVWQAGFLLPLAAIAIATGGVWLARRSGLAMFAVAAGVLPMAPIFIAMFVWNDGDWIHDRYLFIPSMPLCLALGWCVARLARRQRRVTAAAVAALVVTFAVATVWQEGQWDNDLALFSRGVQVAPNNFLARDHLGAAYSGVENYQAAMQQFEAMTKLRPDSPSPLESIASIDSQLGRYREAEAALVRALPLIKRKHRAQSAAAYYQLGVVRLNLKRPQDAEAPLRSAIIYQPNKLGYHAQLATALRLQGKEQEAAAEMAREESLRKLFISQQYRYGVKLNGAAAQ